MRIGAKTLRNNFTMKATADEVDVTFRALALRRGESRNCGLCVVYIQKDGATLLVGAW